MALQDPCLGSILFSGKGITSRKVINVEISRESPGHGIVFELDGAEPCTKLRIPATAQYVVNTLRNVVLGQGATRLCIVEHFLAAASLFGLDDLLVKVDGPEMPLGDGSARFWLDLFRSADWQGSAQSTFLELPQPVICRKGDRLLMAVPDESFSITYLMDWDHPGIGKCWRAWDLSQSIEEIADARTFGSLKEHEMLGIADEVVSLTPSGFSQPLRFADEPVRHKLLDLTGDLALSGVNPRAWKAKFISVKGGHELDVEMARRLSELVPVR